MRAPMACGSSCVLCARVDGVAERAVSDPLALARVQTVICAAKARLTLCFYKLDSAAG